MAVEPHKHCPICGTPIPLNELVCSPDCQKVWDQRLVDSKEKQIYVNWSYHSFLSYLGNNDFHEISDKNDINICKHTGK